MASAASACASRSVWTSLSTARIWSSSDLLSFANAANDRSADAIDALTASSRSCKPCSCSVSNLILHQVSSASRTGEGDALDVEPGQVQSEACLLLAALLLNSELGVFILANVGDPDATAKVGKDLVLGLVDLILDLCELALELLELRLALRPMSADLFPLDETDLGRLGAELRLLLLEHLDLFFDALEPALRCRLTRQVRPRSANDKGVTRTDEIVALSREVGFDTTDLGQDDLVGVARLALVDLPELPQQTLLDLLELCASSARLTTDGVSLTLDLLILPTTGAGQAADATGNVAALVDDRAVESDSLCLDALVVDDLTGNVESVADDGAPAGVVHRALQRRVILDQVDGEPDALCDGPKALVDRFDLDRVERNERRLADPLISHVLCPSSAGA